MDATPIWPKLPSDAGPRKTGEHWFVPCLRNLECHPVFPGVPSTLLGTSRTMQMGAYWQSFSTTEFLAPLGEAWSPADNVRHLTKSMRAVTRGLRMPRWFLRFAFGRTQGPSRSYAAMRDVYLARLAQGADAGRFAPAPRRPAAEPDAERARIMTEHKDALVDLARAVERWPEHALDRHRLPHPLLGRLTVREMLFFTRYHNRHHVEVVQRRVGSARRA